MKRIAWMLCLCLLLSACAAEVPQEVPAPEPVVQAPVPAAPETAAPVYSPVNPDPATYILVYQDEQTAQVGVDTVELPAAPFVENGAFYYPLQFVAEAMGVQYAFDGDCAYLRWEGHETQFFIDSPRFLVDGVEGEASGERALFRPGLPREAVGADFTPKLRGGVVFLPVDYLPAEARWSYNAFGAQMCPANQGMVRFENDRCPPAELETAHAVTLCPGVAEALADGVRTPLPAAPFVEDGIFYFPVEAVAELLGVEYTRSGNSFQLSNARYQIQLFLNSRLYVLDGQTGWRSGWRGEFAFGAKSRPVDDGYVPVERGGVVFLPVDYLEDQVAFHPCTLFLRIEYPETNMVILTQPSTEERGLGGFYLGHKFDETPPETRAGLQCVGKLGEYEGEYDIMGYTGRGLDVHVLRLQPGAENFGCLDGTVSAVSTTSPDYPTPRGLRVGDLPRRAWELYGYDLFHTFYFGCEPPDGPITAIGFVVLKELEPDASGVNYQNGPPSEWFEAPAFWEDQ